MEINILNEITVPADFTKIIKCECKKPKKIQILVELENIGFVFFVKDVMDI